MPKVSVMDTPMFSYGPLSEWVGVAAGAIGVVWAAAQSVVKLKGHGTRITALEQSTAQHAALASKLQDHASRLGVLETGQAKQDAALDKLNDKLDAHVAGLSAQISGVKDQVASIDKSQARIEGMLTHLVARPPVGNP